MKMLLDSHAIIWAVDRPDKLGPNAIAAIQDESNQLLVSAGTIWEIAIKTGLEKLTLSIEFGAWIKQAIQESGITLLPLEIEHTEKQASLPRIHGDPFDRLLAAQCLVEEMQLISSDSALDQYGVSRIW
jgi:PIN domain nuclease of toxin-antitoxin system